jgi:tRNA nucleotidyltransferase/poly(A) polymerase
MDISTLLNKIITVADNRTIYVVGGTIRDKLLKRTLADYDFACIGAPEIATQLSKENNFPLVKLDDTPKRETYRVIATDQTTFDFTALQGETIEADLARRDLTINAMAISLEDFIKGNFSPIDPFDGQEDLKSKTIRVLPGDVLKEDPLRVLRAFRFASQLDFEIEPNTLDRLMSDKEGLSQIPGERIAPELFTTLTSNNSSKTVALMLEANVLKLLIPSSKTKTDQKFILNIYNETELFLNCPENLYPERFNDDGILLDTTDKALVKLSCLIWHLIKDDFADTKKIEKILKELRLSNADTRFILKIIQTADEALITNLDFAGWSTDFSQIYVFVKQAEAELVPGLYLAAGAFKSHLNLDDIEGEGFVRATHNLLDFYRRRYLPAQTQPPLLTGDDLQEEFNLSPSPIFKSILDYIEEGRVLGTIKTKDEAKNMVKSMVESF